MTKSVLITGSSSGIGLETARYFRERGWRVFATMRDPAPLAAELGALGIETLALDVTDAASIARAVATVIERAGRLDAVVNNAGYGVLGPFEATPEDRARRMLDTNFWGALAVMRAVLPQLRRQRSGVIVNVSSVGGRTTMPLYALYHASKFALEGFTESVAFELAPLGVRVKLVEPGAVKTEFNGRSSDVAAPDELADYAETARKGIDGINRAAAKAGGDPRAVAKVVFKAASDGSSRLRYVSGSDAKAMLALRWLLPSRWFSALVRTAFSRVAA
jgi:NAD(P)-dependent dehydrogenase (short-subunit alcohol dehydrogenase family)